MSLGHLSGVAAAEQQGIGSHRLGAAGNLGVVAGHSYGMTNPTLFSGGKMPCPAQHNAAAQHNAVVQLGFGGLPAAEAALGGPALNNTAGVQVNAAGLQGISNPAAITTESIMAIATQVAQQMVHSGMLGSGAAIGSPGQAGGSLQGITQACSLPSTMAAQLGYGAAADASGPLAAVSLLGPAGAQLSAEQLKAKQRLCGRAMYTKVCHKQVHEMSTAELMLLEEEEIIRMSEKSRM